MPTARFQSYEGVVAGLAELESRFQRAHDRRSVAVALANARNNVEQRLAATLIGSRAAVVARLLLAPTINPVAMEACRRVEQGLQFPAWSALTRA